MNVKVVASILAFVVVICAKKDPQCNEEIQKVIEDAVKSCKRSGGRHKRTTGSSPSSSVTDSTPSPQLSISVPTPSTNLTPPENSTPPLVLSEITTATISTGTAEITTVITPPGTSAITISSTPPGTSVITTATSPPTRKFEHGHPCILEQLQANTELSKFIDACPENKYRGSRRKVNCIEKKVKDQCKNRGGEPRDRPKAVRRGPLMDAEDTNVRCTLYILVPASYQLDKWQRNTLFVMLLLCGAMTLGFLLLVRYSVYLSANPHA